MQSMSKLVNDIKFFWKISVSIDFYRKSDSKNILNKKTKRV